MTAVAVDTEVPSGPVWLRPVPQAVLWHGNCLDILPQAPDGYFDVVITDPPYALEYQGQGWDRFTSARHYQEWCAEWAVQCLRLLPPGGRMFVFGGTRTWHRLTSGIEDAGFEIQDSMIWLHSQGMPKGNGQLKPSFEPIVMARKPGPSLPLQIDACRIEANGERFGGGAKGTSGFATGYEKGSGFYVSGKGRYPTNALLDQAVAELMGTDARYFPVIVFHPKVNRAERRRVTVEGVQHPTQKPLGLLRWLVRLASTPGGRILDPFAGSGTTVEAAVLEGRRIVAIEQQDEFLPLTVHRLSGISV